MSLTRTAISLIFSLWASVTLAQLPVIPAPKTSGAFDFTSLGGMFMEFFADDSRSLTNTVDGSAVVSWSNLVSKVGFELITTWNSLGASPTNRSTGGPTGGHAVDFQGNSGNNKLGLQFANAFNSNAPITVLICAQNAVSTVNSGQQTFWDTTAHGFQFTINSATKGGIGGSGQLADLAYADTNWVVHSIVINSTASYHRVNGTLVTYGDGGANGLTTMFFGNDTGFGTQNIGKWVAILGYGKELTTNDLQTAENKLMSRFGIAPSGFTVGTNWASLVINNGGAIPSAYSASVIDTFWGGIIADGYNINNIRFLNSVDTNSLIAALTPFACYSGNSLWINHNFVSGDLSINGLKGNASTKYIDTNFNIRTLGLTSTSAGIIIYMYAVGASGANLDCGAQDGSGEIALFPQYNGNNNAIWDSFNFTVGQGRATVAHTGNGFYSGQRTSNTASSIYFANSGTAFSAITTIATSGGQTPNQPLYFYNENNVGSPIGGNYSDDTLSFLGFTLGTSLTVTSNLNTRVQNLRVALNGGFR